MRNRTLGNVIETAIRCDHIEEGAFSRLVVVNVRALRREKGWIMQTDATGIVFSAS
jgi:hypothetical protein